MKTSGSDKLLLWGAIAAILMLGGSLADIAISMLASAGPGFHAATAQELLVNFQTSPLPTLYGLDLLNLITAIVMIPLVLALAWLHFGKAPALASIAATIFFIGTAAFVAVNPALPMAELARQYGAAGAEQRQILAAAGEAILARGAHGSLGAFPAFMLPTIANILFSLVQLKSGFFHRACGWTGLAGHSGLALYLILASLLPQAKDWITVLAAPAGILVMVWFGLTAIGLFRLSSPNKI